MNDWSDKPDRWARKAEDWITAHPRTFFAALFVIGLAWFVLCIVPFCAFAAFLGVTGG
jgi:hypothetical protein